MTGQPLQRCELIATKSGVSVVVYVDIEDAERIGSRKLSIGSHGYAQLCASGSRVVLLHRWILGLDVGDGRIGDHIDGNPLNNCRSNLRVVDPAQSSANTACWGSTGFRGVYPARKRFVAQAQVRGKLTRIGLFNTPEEAAIAAHEWRLKHMPGYVDRPRARRTAA